jgi:hypothetical protein
MMKGTTLFSALLLGSTSGAFGLSAQQPMPAPLPIDADTETTAGPGWKHRVLTAVGGAALGAGLGYFASQLARSDWDEHPIANPVNRTAWASVGGGMGLAVGFAFPLHGSAKPAMGSPRTVDSRALITLEQIHSVAADNAYDLVRLLRPEWLVARNADIFGDNPSQTLPVYLDDFRLGGLESLRGVALQQVESIRLLSTSAATARWGIGNTNGAIQVITSG